MIQSINLFFLFLSLGLNLGRQACEAEALLLTYTPIAQSSYYSMLTSENYRSFLRHLLGVD